MCFNTSMTPTPSLIIIGASGDLTRRLLMPALYRLEKAGKLPPLNIVGYALEDWSSEYFRDHIEKGLLEFEREVDLAAWEKFSHKLDYRSGDLSVEKIRALEQFTQGEASFYLALPPGVFAAAAQGLGEAGMALEARWVAGITNSADRPLSGQGNSAKPDGISLRQHAHRAPVEQPGD